MTISDYHVTMKSVGIAELKARLSEYLRHVRRGDSLLVVDRKTPIARIIPAEEATPLSVRKPAVGSPKPSEVRLPAPAGLDIDVVDLLLEDRASGR